MRRQRSLSASRHRDHSTGKGAHRTFRARRTDNQRAVAGCDAHVEIAAVKEAGDAMADEHRSRLGRGLAALMGDVVADKTIAENGRSNSPLPVEFLKPNTAK